ncbi:AMP-binding protein [Serinibacter arcticus]|uniref:AMP-binding protein n=1 Tax=Serinibacter arcticus TaxID=1655435 RepID=UPI001304FE4B|nr:AMP-binding protein [Serinibacter arcticus]
MLTAVPAQLAALLDAHAAAGAPALALRSVVTGSAPLASALAEEAGERLGARVTDFFGTSETGTATIARPADLAAEPGTVGRAALGVRLRVVDGGGRAVTGAPGRLEIASPWRAAGTASGFRPTGDLAILGPSGLLHLRGRTDDVAVVGGHNVDLAGVRRWLAAQGDLVASRLEVVSDARLGSRLVVRARSGTSEAELRRRARQELGAAAAPRDFVLVPERTNGPSRGSGRS